MSTLKNNLIRFALSVCTCLCLAACGGGGGDTTVAGGGGGVVGTGKQVTVTGQVTGFGSIIVNGIEFTKSTSAGVSASPILLAFDNLATSDETRLRPGMVVSLSGTYDPAIATGSYTQVVFSPELRGLLDNGSVNAGAGTFSVFGRQIQVDVGTVFEGIADIAGLQAHQAEGLELEISGYLNSGAVLQATRVAVKSSGGGAGRVQLKGVVNSWNGTSFAIGSATVPIAGATFVGMTAADLGTAGLVVEVRGTLSGGSISGARIERKDATSGAASGGTLNIKGIAAGVPVAGGFVLSGPDGPLLVTIGSASFFRGGIVSDVSIVSPGAQLDIEGVVQPDGSLAAAKVAAEIERTVRLEGNLSATDVPNGTLTVNGVTLSTFSGTSFRDNRNPPAPVLALAGLTAGDHLQVYGFIDSVGRVIASQVERFDASSNAMVQGPVAALNSGLSQLSILGVTVVAQPGAVLSKGGTVYADFTSFASQLAVGSTVVKAKGALSAGTFSVASLEIQQ